MALRNGRISGIFIQNFFSMRSLAVTVVCTLTACAGYQLGPSNGMEPGSRTVSVNYFLNRSPEPGLVDQIMTALRREIQVDGTYALETHGDGHFVIDGEILDIDREAISLNPSRIEASRDLRLSLVCRVVVTKRRTGEIVHERTVTARTVIRNEGDLNRADQVVAPMMAETLARKIVSLIADGEWDPDPQDPDPEFPPASP